VLPTVSVRPPRTPPGVRSACFWVLLFWWRLAMGTSRQHTALFLLLFLRHVVVFELGSQIGK
jgi:hypothetical protein